LFLLGFNEIRAGGSNPVSKHNSLTGKGLVSAATPEFFDNWQDSGQYTLPMNEIPQGLTRLLVVAAGGLLS